MARLIDLDNPDVVFCGHDGDYLRYNIWEELPTVDAVPVVRCKDCKYWSGMCDESYLGEPGLGKCRNERFFAFEYGFETEDSFTCADGKRKGGEG